MREYELTVLIAPTLSGKELDKTVKNLTDLLTKAGAKITKKVDPVKKSLSYEIAKVREAFCVFFEIELPPGATLELDKKPKTMENVIRHLLVRKN